MLLLSNYLLFLRVIKYLPVKNIKKIALVSFLVSGFFFGLTSFSNPSKSNEIVAEKSNIEFKIINDNGNDFKYCANGGHNTISKGTTKSMSFPVGTEIKYVDGGNCGNTWFKVTSEMNGKTFKISQMAR
jgi:hypothetical protein